jgi:hypothetical protein
MSENYDLPDMIEMRPKSKSEKFSQKEVYRCFKLNSGNKFMNYIKSDTQDGIQEAFTFKEENMDIMKLNFDLKRKKLVCQ